MFSIRRAATVPASGSTSGSSTYVSLSDRSNSSKSEGNTSQRGNNSSSLMLEASPTDVKVYAAILTFKHGPACQQFASLAGKYRATVIQNGRILTFNISTNVLKTHHANCTYEIKGIVETTKSLPADCHQVFTTKGNVEDILPILDAHASLDTSETEIQHGNKDKILEEE